MALRDQMQTALTRAIKARDSEAVSALRGALAAVAEAEAVPAPQRSGTEVMLGVGPSEVPRRTVSDADVVSIVQREIDERQAAAARLHGLGHGERAARLVREAAVLQAQLGS